MKKVAQKPQLDFGELVDFYAGRILTRLIAGEYRSAVWEALHAAIEWHKEQSVSDLAAMARRERRRALAAKKQWSKTPGGKS